METYTENYVNSGDISLETILSEGSEIPDFPDYRIMKDGSVVSLKKEKPKILKTAQCGYKKHYSFVVLCNKQGTKPCNVHTLVANAFIPNPDNKEQVNHIDGNTYNNHYTNLEWVTAKENSNHAINTGLSPTGDKCPWAKHSNSTVIKICEMLEQGKATKEIRLALDVDSRLISKIKSRTNWKQISRGYDF